MPEADDLTPSEHDRVARKRSFLASKKIRRVLEKYGAYREMKRGQVVLSRGKESSKAGSITGVKS